jgi:hypothetical protein
LLARNMLLVWILKLNWVLVDCHDLLRNLSQRTAYSSVIFGFDMQGQGTSHCDPWTRWLCFGMDLAQAGHAFIRVR